MKKLMMAVAACVCAVGAFAETTDNYVQDGLIACWDGYENIGIEGRHALALTEWKDTSGTYSFVFNANSGIAVDGSALAFSGANGCYAKLGADATAATFEQAKTGTVEIVILSDPTTAQKVALQSSAASGIAFGALARSSASANASLVTSNSNRPLATYNWSSEITTFAVTYSAAQSQAVWANAEALSLTGQNNFGASGTETFLGFRANLSSGQAFQGRIYAIRLYATQLTEDQIAANHAVDVKRFVEGDLYGEGVYSEGFPQDFAVGNLPAYGFVEKSVGETVELTAPEMVEVSENERAYCVGWKLYDCRKGWLVAESTEENKTRCAFEYEKPVRLVWQWKVLYRAAPVVADGLTVSPTEVWLEGGEEAAFTVTGTDYPVWTVNGVASPGRSTSIAVKGAAGLELSVVGSRLIYVTQDGAGQKDGTSWGNAFDSIQAAVDAAGTDASTIFLLQGDYTLSAELSIGEGANLVFVGGCTGSRSEVGTEKSVLIRNAEVASMRLLNVTGATASFSDIVFRGGLLKPANSYGHGVNSANSALAFTRCTFDSNGVTGGTGDVHRGGGLAADGGSVRLNDCAFTKNNVTYGGGTTSQLGGGIWAKNAALELVGCLFATNYINSGSFGARGGAIYASGGSALITNCVFNGNYLTHGSRGYQSWSDRRTWGGAIFFEAVPSVTIVDSTFDGNYSNNYDGGITEFSGGTIYFSGAAGNATIRRCKFLRSGVSGFTTATSTDTGSITLAGGTASIFNTLFVGTHANALEVSGGTLEIRNVTAVGGDREAILQKAGTVTVANSIIWGNTPGTTDNGAVDFTGGSLDVTYSDVQGGYAGFGNFAEDPLFADDVYCHPKSRAGHYDGGWFSGGTWVADATNSPAIDAAAASDAVGDEPQPNGHRLNIGYDAGTPVASKTYLGEPAVPTALAMYIHPFVEPGEDAVTVEGEFGLAANGRATVTVCWGATDGGTVATDWAHSEEIGVFSDWTVVSKHLTDLEGKTFVRLKADDGESVAWSAALEYAPLAKATLSGVSVTHLMRNTLQANGTLASDGGAPASVRFRYWTDDEGAAVIIDYNYGNPIAVGESFAIEVEGLEPGTTYHYAIEAVNSAGPNGETQEVTTRSLDEPITVYVTTTGAGIEDGSNWANAYSKLQTAFDVCKGAGDVIHLAAGEYTVGQAHDVNEVSRYFAFDAAGLTVNGDPNGGTVLLPGGAAARLFHAKNATITFNDVTFRGGRLNPANSYGHGVYGENSALIFNRCTFDDNGATAATGDVHRGGGLAADGGSVRLNDCVFTKNTIKYNGGTTSQLGGGVWAKNATLELVGCLFATNCINTVSYGSRGGAIYASGGSALITNCVFNGNYVTHDERGYRSWSDRKTLGGAIFFEAVPSVTIVDSTFDGNFANNYDDGITSYSGGTIYLSGAKGVATIERCKILRGGVSGYTTATDTDNGAITLAAGTAGVVNCLVAGMHSNAFEVAGGTLAITNVTVVGGDREPVLQKGGTVTVVNSIFWDNVSETGVSFDLKGGTTEVSHSDMLGGFEGEGNLDTDPLLYAPTKKRAYHLRTASPCVGKGDASVWTAADTDLDGLPRLRNGKVDLGCYSFNAPGLMLLLK